MLLTYKYRLKGKRTIRQLNTQKHLDTDLDWFAEIVLDT